MGPGLGTEVEVEVEALAAVYSDVGVTTEPAEAVGDAALVRVGPLGPREVGCPGVAFVGATLALGLPAGYPEAPAEPRLEAPLAALGRGRASDLTRSLEALALEMARDGAPALLVLCDQLQDLLGAANFPAGACSVCLEPLAPGPDPVTVAAAQCVRLPGCGHSFHRACLRAWLRWCDAQAEERLAPGPHQAGGGKPSSEVPVRRCPLCRGPVGEAAAEALRGHGGSDGGGDGALQGEGGGDAAESALKAERGRQRARQERFARQQKCGGIIDTRPIELEAGGGISLLRTTVESSHRLQSGGAIAPFEPPDLPPEVPQPRRGRGRGNGSGRGRGRGRGRGGGEARRGGGGRRKRGGRGSRPAPGHRRGWVWPGGLVGARSVGRGSGAPETLRLHI